MYSGVIVLSLALLALALLLGILKFVASYIFQVSRRVDLMEKQCNQNVRIINELSDWRESIFDAADLQRISAKKENEI